MSKQSRPRAMAFQSWARTTGAVIPPGLSVKSLMCASSCGALCMTVDGNIVVSGHFDGTLRFWDVRKGDIVHEVEGLHSLQMTSVVLSPSGCEVRLVADVL
jgi:WD40 repeat protein